MSTVAAGEGIAIRVDAETVTLGVVSRVHPDGTVDGMVYPPDGDPVMFAALAVLDEPSDVVGAAWHPASNLSPAV
ncbi:hypothetical protein [Paraburkholderia caribensis]|uniref:hypothetical protein n=1 Tax=Paraburkholderia caribensis TaxID=75105 RepID=UPI001CAE843E|nr:hypothetical protein [Paraburkholderia caribensis]CAG9256040.1 hypothetical protein PCAR4_40204 [Paraburkholderia caribensis]